MAIISRITTIFAVVIIVLINLLLLEMMVKRGKSSLELLRELYDRFGEFHFRRRDFHVSPEKGKRQVAALAARPPKSLCGVKVESVDQMDGTKVMMADGSWILFRQSGTEPALRVYCEAPYVERVTQMIGEGMGALGEADKG